jgi:hypothetical protein
LEWNFTIPSHFKAIPHIILSKLPSTAERKKHLYTRIAIFHALEAVRYPQAEKLCLDLLYYAWINVAQEELEKVRIEQERAEKQELRAIGPR